MSDSIHDPEALAATAIFLIALAVGLVLLRRHPSHDMVPSVGRQFNTTVAAVPLSGERLPQNSPHLADVHRSNHIVYPVAALRPPSPPPNYLEYRRDVRIDGAVPSYSNTGSSRGNTVDVVPAPSTNPSPAENADLDEDEEGGNV